MPGEPVLCESCGEAIEPTAKFCTSCGAPRIQSPEEPSSVSEAATEADPAPRATEGESGGGDGSAQHSASGAAGPLSKAGPAADEFTEALKGYVSLPGVRLAGVAALIGAGIILAVTLVIVLVVPGDSALSLGGDGSQISLLREILFQAVTMNLAGITFSGAGVELSLAQAPLAFVLIPLLGVGFGVYAQRKETADWSPRMTVLWGAAAGVPFALIMVLLGVLAGGEIGDSGADASVNLGGTFLLALIWGALGGLSGTMFALRKEAVEPLAAFPGKVASSLKVAADILVPFAAALLIASVIGSSVWIVQSVRDAADARADRGLPAALIDSVAYSGDLGVRYIGLGTGAQFELSSVFAEQAASPIPLSYDGTSDSKLSQLTDDGEFNLFSYEGVLSSWVFLPLTLLLIAVPALLALYAGFVSARNRRTPSQGIAAAWGALVGPVWALTVVILNALSEDIIFGSLSGDSVLAIVLIAGSVIGAGGGLLAFHQGATGQATREGQSEGASIKPPEPG